MGDLKERVELRAFAKVNYALEVRGIRDDGYHEISTVMQSMSLSDEVSLELAEEGFEPHIEPKEVEIGPLESNTIYRAWKSLREMVIQDLPVKVRLHKKIPAGAGLGGGSADAAAVLVGLNELFGLGLSQEELRGVGGRVGADVPFCIAGGTALGEGVGEKLTPLTAPPDHYLLVLKPSRGADTGGIYRAHDEDPAADLSFVQPVLDALRARDLSALARSVGNVLSPVTKKAVPEVDEHERYLLNNGALGAAMTGTGTAVYGIFATEQAARKAETKLRAPFIGAFEPVSRGVEII